MINYIDNDSFTILQNHVSTDADHVLEVKKVGEHAVLLNAIERGLYDINGNTLEINKRASIVLTYDKFREFVNNCLLLINGCNNEQL